MPNGFYIYAMRFTFGLIIIYCILIAYTQLAIASEGEKTVAMPLGAWDVQPFYKQDGFPTEECIMRTRYDNNLEVTFKGKNRQFTAIRVKDMAQSPQSQIKGFIGLGLEKNSYGLQSRSQNGQIDASLLTVPAPAQKMMDIDHFRLRLGTDDYFFSTQGMREGYDSFLTCLGQEQLETLKIVNDPISYLPNKSQRADNMPSIPVDNVVTEELYDFGDGNYELLPSIPMEAPAPLPEMTPRIDENNQAWMATKGDSLKETLNEWAGRANVKTEINLESDITLPKDFAILGPFDIAVTQLLKEVDAATQNTALSAGFKADNGAVIDLIEPNVSKAVAQFNNPENAVIENTSPRQWQALQGTNLRSVIQRWSARENIDFIWQADEIFIIKNSLRDARNFNEAVAALIAQFDNQKVRPVATLNIDPETNRKSVIITSVNAE